MNRTEHLLVKLTEECSEVIKDVSKALIFGLDDFEPNQDLKNSEKITNELADIIGVMEMLIEERVISPPKKEAINAKKVKVEKYIKYATDLGALV